MERGVVIVEVEDEDGSEDGSAVGMWMPGGRVGDVFEVVALALLGDEEPAGGGKRIQYLRPERTAFQALSSC